MKFKTESIVKWTLIIRYSNKTVRPRSLRISALQLEMQRLHKTKYQYINRLGFCSNRKDITTAQYTREQLKITAKLKCKSLSVDRLAHGEHYYTPLTPGLFWNKVETSKNTVHRKGLNGLTRVTSFLAAAGWCYSSILGVVAPLSKGACELRTRSSFDANTCGALKGQCFSSMKCKYWSRVQ